MLTETWNSVLNLNGGALAFVIVAECWHFGGELLSPHLVK